MDSFASLALATDKPNMRLLEHKPYGRNEHFITPLMWRNIIMHTLYQLAVFFALLFAGKYIPGLFLSDPVNY